VDQAVGERGFYAAQVGADFPFVLRRVGKRVQWVLKNTSFTADKGTPAARATARSFPDAVLGSAKVASRPHPDRKSLLIDAGELFSTDLPGFAAALNRAYDPTSYRFDKENSGLTGVKAFPENVLLDVSLHYATDNPRSRTVTLADPRSVPMAVKYELSALKETSYRPRAADDRVGHFHTVQQDFTNDLGQSPYVRYITRWHLEKVDPAAKVSPPKQPIVFWLENTIPVEYRDYMKEGALLWNRAFERIGFKDAVVVKQQPDDADWDPADTRYNTIRWFAGVDAFFAIGPSRANPYTGQIYDADIGFSEGIIRNARRTAEEFVSPTVPTALDEVPPVPPAWAWAGRGRWMCQYASGMAEQAAIAFSLLESRGALSPEVEKRVVREYIVEVTAHEVGHTLGLRHNFRGSSLLKNEELVDTARTTALGQSASVMDYNPIVVAPKGKTQGEFVGTSLGPYDYWAIEYAYKPVEGDEKGELAHIASRAATDPQLPYSTDEDALGTYSALSIDPLANQYDQSSDPLAYFQDRVGLVHELWGSMEHKLTREGDGYQILRRAMGRSMNEMFRSLVTSTKFVGGVYHYRDHVGDPGGRVPFVPVPAAKQREALAFVNANAFGEKAFQVPPSVLNKLAVDRMPTLDFYTYFNTQRLDFPWHDSVLSVQRAVLQRLYHPVTLGRLVDNELRFNGEKPFKMAEMFSSTRGAIWAELDKGAAEIPSLRRNLQREHLKTLIRLALRQPLPGGSGAPGNPFAPPPPPPAPEDATTLARSSLSQIQSKVRATLVSGRALDATTKAHLQETQARISAALDPTVVRAIE
jgi:hypothetical protein